MSCWRENTSGKWYALSFEHGLPTFNSITWVSERSYLLKVDGKNKGSYPTLDAAKAAFELMRS